MPPFLPPFAFIFFRLPLFALLLLFRHRTVCRLLPYRCGLPLERSLALTPACRSSPSTPPCVLPLVAAILPPCLALALTFPPLPFPYLTSSPFPSYILIMDLISLVFPFRPTCHHFSFLQVHFYTPDMMQSLSCLRIPEPCDPHLWSWTSTHLSTPQHAHTLHACLCLHTCLPHCTAHAHDAAFCLALHAFTFLYMPHACTIKVPAWLYTHTHCDVRW